MRINVNVDRKFFDSSKIRLVQGEALATKYEFVLPVTNGQLAFFGLTYTMRGTSPECETSATQAMSAAVDGSNVVLSWIPSANFSASPGKMLLIIVGANQAGTEIIKIDSEPVFVGKDASTANYAIATPNVYEQLIAQVDAALATVANVDANETIRDENEAQRLVNEGERETAETEREELAEMWKSPCADAVSGSAPDASVTVDVNGVKFHFVLKQGEQGEPGRGLTILGTYPSVEALRAEVTGAEIGDMYNVGAAALYNVFRWTGTDWEDNGNLKGAPGDVSSVDAISADEHGNVNLGIVGSDVLGAAGALTLAGVSGTEAVSKLQIIGESVVSGIPAYDAPITVAPILISKVSIGSNEFSFTTATELHGMAVNTNNDGNVMYNDQKYLSDVYDAATDKLVKHWDVFTYDGTENWAIEYGLSHIVRIALPEAIKTFVGMSTHFVFTSNSTWRTGEFRVTSTTNGKFIKVCVTDVVNTSDSTQTVALWKEWLAAQNTAGTPVKFYVARDTAVESYNICDLRASDGIVDVLDGSDVHQDAKLIVRYNDVWESMRVLRERTDRYNTALSAAIAELAAT